MPLIWQQYWLAWHGPHVELAAGSQVLDCPSPISPVQTRPDAQSLFVMQGAFDVPLPLLEPDAALELAPVLELDPALELEPLVVPVMLAPEAPPEPLPPCPPPPDEPGVLVDPQPTTATLTAKSKRPR